MEGSAPAAPKSVGRYTLAEPIGRGASATVWRAFDPELERDVAVKLVERWHGLGSTRAEATSRVIREARAVAALNHPNIVPIFDVGRFEAAGGASGVFLAMEYLPGQSLRTWLRKTTPSHVEILRAFDQAAAALHAAHQAGVVHRDFKPSNAMIDADGRVRVIDFGLARPIGGTVSVDAAAADPDHPVVVPDLDASLTTTGTVMGTPAYMSPEQHVGDPLGAASDQYSFCVALFEALAGQRPFHSKNVRALHRHKRSEQPEGADALPPRLRPIVLRGLRVDPSARWPDMEALRLALRPRRRRLGWLPAAGVAVVVGGGALALPRTPPPAVSTPQVSTSADPTLEHVRLLRETGHLDEALAEGEALLEARRGDAHAEARAVAEHARTLAWNGDDTRATRLREAAYHQASTAGDHALAFDLAVALAHHAFDRDPSDAHRWSGQAAAALERAPNEPAAEARLLVLQAREAEQAYDVTRAADLLERARGLLDGQDAIETELQVLEQTAMLEARQGRFEQHQALFQYAVARGMAEYGPDHPRVAELLAQAASTAVYMGHVESSHWVTEDAVSLVQRHVPPTHVMVGKVRTARALTLAQLGEVEAALDDFAAAEEAYAALPSETDRAVGLASVWSIRGLTRYALGDLRGGLRDLRRAHDSHVRVLGEHHLETLTDGNNLAMVLRDAGRPDEAEREARAVAAAFEGSQADPSMRSFTYEQLGQLLLDAGKHGEARLWAERAVEAWDDVGADRPESAQACFLAAKAALPSDRDAAERWARATLTRVDDAHGASVVRAWLVEHGFEPAP